MSTPFPGKNTDGYLNTFRAYQAAVNEASIVSITDMDGVIIYVNDKFVEVSKYTEAELIGNTHRIINSSYHPPKFFSELWKTIRSGKPWRGDIKNKAKDGTYYWVDTVITPVLDKQKKVFQFLSIRNLITAKKESEQKLQKAQERLLKSERLLKDAQQVSKTGSWHLDLTHNTLEWSEESYRIFGVPEGTPMTYELFLDLVAETDRERVDKSWRAALEGAPYDIEHRIQTKSGEKWVREMARMEFDEKEQLKAGIGIVQDITEIKRAEILLEESETLYRYLFNYSPFPKAIARKTDLRFLEVNETALHVYGYDRQEFLQMTGYDFWVPEEQANLIDLAEGERYMSPIRTHRKKNGELMRVETFLDEINFKRETCYLITIHDVTEQLRLQEELIQEKLNYQRAITRTSIEAQEKNRAEIGRELHDNINQLLVASSCYLKAIHPVSKKGKFSLEKSLELTVAAIKEIKDLSHAMVPPSLRDLTLKEAIKGLAFHPGVAQMAVKFKMRMDESRLSDGLKISIYRIIQEQFNNIIKHAAATKISVHIEQDDDALYLEISDDGRGFNLTEVTKGRGIGLNNIIYRAETYNGKVTINTRPGEGCQLYITFVLK